MKVQNSVKPKNSFEIENIEKGKCDIVFYTNLVETTKLDENNEEQTVYEYEIYRITADFREEIKEVIESDYQKWLDYAKQFEYNNLAEQVRQKRNELLAATDKEMCIDRLNLNLPTELSAATLLTGVRQFFEAFSNIVNGNIAKYRQELRDITKQEGFPYNVIWPTKDKDNKEE